MAHVKYDYAICLDALIKVSASVTLQIHDVQLKKGLILESGKLEANAVYFLKESKKKIREIKGGKLKIIT